MSLNRNVIKGSLWVVALRMMIKGIGIISTMFLARLLLPSDFGLIALAMVYYAFVELIQAFGFDMALIQNQNATKEHYDTVWTVQVIFGVLSAVIVFLTANYTAVMLETPLLEDILKVLSLMFLIQGMRNVGTVNFTKHFEFHKEFILRTLPKIVTAILTIILAYIYRSYWVLVFGMVFNVILTVIFSYIICSYRPSFNLSKATEIVSFSKWILINNVLIFANNKLQNLWIGYKSGSEALGMFSISSELGNIIPDEVVAPMNKATYPAYSKLVSEYEVLRTLYLNTLSTIALIALPSSIGLAIVSPVLIPILLGDQWGEAIVLIQIIAIAAAIRSITTNADYIFMAIGKPRLISFLFSIRLLILLPLLLFLTESEGAEGAAKAILWTTVVIFPVSVFLTVNTLKIVLKDYIAAIFNPFVATSVMVVGLSLYEINGSLTSLLISIFIGRVLFLSTLFLLWYLTGRPQNSEKKLLDLVLSRLPLKKV